MGTWKSVLIDGKRDTRPQGTIEAFTHAMYVDAVVFLVEAIPPKYKGRQSNIKQYSKGTDVPEQYKHYKAISERKICAKSHMNVDCNNTLLTVGVSCSVGFGLSMQSCTFTISRNGLNI